VTEGLQVIKVSLFQTKYLGLAAILHLQFEFKADIHVEYSRVKTA
jgi:hypothetical protein